MKALPYLLAFLFIALFFTSNGCDDLPILFGNQAKKCMIEHDIEQYNEWTVESSQSTFQNDISFKRPSNTGNTSLSYFNFYSGTTLCTLQRHFQNYGHRTYAETGYPNYFVQSYYMYLTGFDQSVLGLANNFRTSDTQWTNICPGIRNWSFIFRNNIELWNISISGSFTTAMNYVITHELAHQIGNAIYDGVHDDHNGDAPEQCVLNWPNPSIEDTVQSGAHSFGICPRHRNMVKNGPDLRVPQMAGDNNILQKNDNALYRKINDYRYTPIKSRSELSISLSKTHYKLYEPILIDFKYVNKSNDVDTIFLNFVDPHDRAVDFFVHSENGTEYTDRIMEMPWLVYEKPSYFIQPNDTFFVSMVLNHNFGERVPNGYSVFNHYGYFKPGKYSLYAEDMFGKEFVRTNELNFEVTNPSVEDNQIIDLLRSASYQRVVNEYSHSEYSEHAEAQLCIQMNPTELGKKDLNSLNNAYGNFIAKFPMSLYNENIMFVNGYFDKIASEVNSIESAMNSISSRSSGSLFDRFVNNEPVKKKLIQNYNLLKKGINEEKNNNKK